MLEGCGQSAMQMKDIGASFLSMFPGNADLRRAFAFLREAREKENHISVRLRASFATWAPVEEAAKLRRRMSTLSQRIEGWGNAKATTVVGDPLEGRDEHGARVWRWPRPPIPRWRCWATRWRCCPGTARRRPGRAAACCSGGRTAASGPTTPPAAASAPWWWTSSWPRRAPGNRCSANTINIGLCLSSAVMGTNGAKLPLIGKADIGKSAEGFVRLIQEALGPRRRHEAIFTSLQFAPGHEFNIFDLQVGCEYPLPLETRLPAELSGAGDAAARPVDAVRGHGAADLAGHRRGLPALHRDRRRRQALSGGVEPEVDGRSSATASSCTRSRPTGATS